MRYFSPSLTMLLVKRSRMSFRFSEPQRKLSPGHGIQQRFRPVDFVRNGQVLLIRHPQQTALLVMWKDTARALFERGAIPLDGQLVSAINECRRTRAIAEADPKNPWASLRTWVIR